MKYFIDTEFIEGFRKPLFGKRRHFIDLISIGVVCEDGREYYAISTDFKTKDASEWVKKNVISQLPDRYAPFSDPGTSPRSRMEAMQWKPTKVIVTELLDFFGCWRDQHFWRAPKGIEVYGYYADYDWVLFCSLFGRMIDLPKGFPMYCHDLKQMFDEKAESIDQLEFTGMLVSGTNWKVVGEISKKVMNIDEYSSHAKIELLKAQAGYPKQTNEHNALADAKWNYELYKFLTIGKQHPTLLTK